MQCECREKLYLCLSIKPRHNLTLTINLSIISHYTHLHREFQCPEMQCLLSKFQCHPFYVHSVSSCNVGNNYSFILSAYFDFSWFGFGIFLEKKFWYYTQEDPKLWTGAKFPLVTANNNIIFFCTFTRWSLKHHGQKLRVARSI